MGQVGGSGEASQWSREDMMAAQTRKRAVEREK